MLMSIREGDFTIDKMVKFRIGKNEFRTNGNGFIWKDANEFEYNRMLYDVVKIVKEKEVFILYCLNDITEEKIVKTFNDEVNDLATGKISHSKYKTSLINLITQAVCFNPFQLTRPAVHRKYFSDNFMNPPAIVAEIPLPPPKLI
jgi:hypothetical protein